MSQQPYGVRRLGRWTFYMALCGSVFMASAPVHAFTIMEPAPGAKLTSGQTVTAHVDLGNDIGIVKVRYYWYREQDETLVQQDETDSGPSKSGAKISMDKFLQKDSVVGGSVVSLPGSSQPGTWTRPSAVLSRFPRMPSDRCDCSLWPISRAADSAPEPFSTRSSSIPNPKLSFNPSTLKRTNPCSSDGKVNPPLTARSTSSARSSNFPSSAILPTA